MILNIPRQIRKINRLRTIATILVKYQVISISKSISVISPVTLVSRLLDSSNRITKQEDFAVLIRRIFEELGTTFIKFGQWLSVRPDFVSPEILKELEKLQDRLPEVPFKTIKQTIEQETGKSINEIFSQFSQQPISSASIAQVHCGVLKTGEIVAVKVQRPELKKLISVDIDILKTMARWAVRKTPHLALHRFDELLSSFKNTLMEELDFIHESKRQDRMERVLSKMPWVHIPKIYWEYTTKHLIVMQYIEGVKLTQKEYIQNYKGDRNLLGERLNDCVFRSIFEYGFFQSDPHPGNVLIMEESEFAIVDFGMTESLDKVTVNALLKWYYAAIYRDIDMFAETFLKMGTPLAPIDEIEFRNDCIDFIDEIHYQPSSNDISVGNLLEIINHIQYQHKITLPTSFVLLFRTICFWDGTFRYVGVDFDWRKDWGPKLKKLIQSQFLSESVVQDMQKSLLDYKQLISKYPANFQDIVDKIKEGKLKVEIEETSLIKQLTGIQKGLNKLAVSIFVSTIIFGLFYLGRGQGNEFLLQIITSGKELWWIFLLIILMFFYLRKK
ncbi:2-polyprenylphenol 6-hydroxylase [Candidatus Scalindua japonica]|uniref:2-polyprenylphenol 6-hydroxylase n=1 Tax=Candidatus Scalindua japonica TaxID=1284222 RepID=A0A286TTH8_9BACT|nr:AarF/UbiB family protein [Candidatus Scalindua japonica]GAX59164.1 2-polyprenylphenol 6-hydroxylase [Candidatus Scalindua japonica]